MDNSENAPAANGTENEDQKRQNPRLSLASLERELEKDEEQLRQLQEDMKKLKHEIRNWLHILG